MGGACCLHDTGVQKLTLNMLCPFLTSPGEDRPQHYITQEGKQPLYGQRDYSNKLYICHKAKSDKGQKCQYATIYDTHYEIPLISAKKYTSQPLETSERSDWTFSGGLKKIAKERRKKKSGQLRITAKQFTQKGQE